MNEDKKLKPGCKCGECVVDDYNLKEEFNTRVHPLISDLMDACRELDMPIIITVAVASVTPLESDTADVDYITSAYWGESRGTAQLDAMRRLAIAEIDGARILRAERLFNALKSASANQMPPDEPGFSYSNPTSKRFNQ